MLQVLVYPLSVTGLGFVAAIVGSLAWPAAIVIVVILIRRELVSIFRCVQFLEFPGGKATFAALVDYDKLIGATADGESTTKDEANPSQETILDLLADVAPGQAIIDAWGLLEYQLNVASDRLAPGQPHGWPQVANNLATWDRWPMLSPAVFELRRLRDHTERSRRPPSRAEAARYVSVANDLVSNLRFSVLSASSMSSRRSATPEEAIETQDGGEVRRIEFPDDEIILLDRSDEGQIVNWTTSLRPSAAAKLALEVSTASNDRVATVCIDNNTSETDRDRLASMIAVRGEEFDQTCSFIRIDFDDKSVAFQLMSNEQGQAFAFFGVGADRLDIGLVSSLIDRTATEAISRAMSGIGGNGLSGRLRELLSEDPYSHVPNQGGGLHNE